MGAGSSFLAGLLNPFLPMTLEHLLAALPGACCLFGPFSLVGAWRVVCAPRVCVESVAWLFEFCFFWMNARPACFRVGLLFVLFLSGFGLFA